MAALRSALIMGFLLAGSLNAQTPPAADVKPMPVVPSPYTGVPMTTREQLTTSPFGFGCGDACTPACAPACCDPCGPAGRFWLRAEYLLWFPSGGNQPPLVSFSPNGVPRTQAGVLGTPGATILHGGNSDLNDDSLSGFRIRTGMWLDPCNKCGIEGNMFSFSNRAESASYGSPTGLPIVSRPFFNAATGLQDAELVSFADLVPGTVGGFSPVLTGFVTIDNGLDLWGMDFNGRANLVCCCNYRLDLLAGYRYFRLAEYLNITENLTTADASRGVPVGTSIIVRDQFRTENEFHGGQVGLAGEFRRGAVFLDWRALIAIGNLHQQVQIAGSTTVTPPGGASSVRTGGLLAQRSNIGTYNFDEFAILPELGFNVGLQLTPQIRIFAGYSFLYLNNVVRAGDAIDYTVNPTFLTGASTANPNRPIFQKRTDDFTLHGLSFGAEIRF